MAQLSFSNFRSIIRPTVLTRPEFVHNGGVTPYTILVSGSGYNIKDKLAFWNSQLTTNAIGSPVASTWYYLYIDYSAITSNIAVTANELIWSTTAPTWNQQYGGWYNGDDLCIFAVRTNSTPDDIVMFYNTGERLVQWSGESSIGVDSSSWTDRDLGPSGENLVPEFCRKAQMAIYCYDSGFSTNIYSRWRPKDHTGDFRVANARLTLGVDGGDWIRFREWNQFEVELDEDNIFENYTNDSDGHGQWYFHGWFLPLGM